MQSTPVMKFKKNTMKTLLLIIPIIFFFCGCSHSDGEEEIKKEIFQAEKAFERMTSEKGIAEAFYYFADVNAIIKRGNDTLISGKENIRMYYDKKRLKNATVIPMLNENAKKIGSCS